MTFESKKKYNLPKHLLGTEKRMKMLSSKMTNKNAKLRKKRC